MPRQARLDAPGTLHHVIVRGIEKRRIVDNQRDREAFVSRLGELASSTETTIYAWALMTNHAHILAHSGQSGLPIFMRRLLTGYAVEYNLRHKRHGHLFQNRYKSIVCEEDTYFLELVRYIHLNPLRAGLVKDLDQLHRYRWSGHSAVMGKVTYAWQNRDRVLAVFGNAERSAVQAYGEYMKEGVLLGSRPELVGGGLIRSAGGWSQVKSPFRKGEGERFDERILGSGEFVERTVAEAEEKIRRQFPVAQRQREAKAALETLCREEDVTVAELLSGSRRKPVSAIRKRLIWKFVGKFGLPQAEIARMLGISAAAVAKTLARQK